MREREMQQMSTGELHVAKLRLVVSILISTLLHYYITFMFYTSVGEIWRAWTMAETILFLTSIHQNSSRPLCV